MAGRLRDSSYDLSWPAIVSGDTSALFGPLLLRDEARNQAVEAERHFNDLYHFFLNRFARLSHDSELTEEESKRLTALLAELLEAKKKLAALE